MRHNSVTVPAPLYGSQAAQNPSVVTLYQTPASVVSVARTCPRCHVSEGPCLTPAGKPTKDHAGRN